MIVENISKIRKSWRLNQEDFAKLFGLTKMAFQAYESGRNSPSVEFLLKLEDYTGVSVKRLWREAIPLKDIPEAPLDSVSGTTANEPPAVYGEILVLKKAIEDLEKRVLNYQY